MKIAQVLLLPDSFARYKVSYALYGGFVCGHPPPS
jgi:hypothetical protein